MEGEFIFLFLTITVVVGSWVPTSPQPAFNCNLQVQRFENLLSKHGCSSELQLNRMKRDDDDDATAKRSCGINHASVTRYKQRNGLQN